MKIELMVDKSIWVHVVHYLYLDQGLETPTTMEVEESPDLPVAARYLETLSNNELCTFCIGDQGMIEIATDRGSAPSPG